MPNTSVDDDDIGALFHAKRIASMEKRASNREYSTNLLVAKGVYFTSHNAGAHLVVAEAWNFWPGTGKFCERKGKPGQPKREGRGIQRLLKIIEEEKVK